jgi:hypothetical protein
LATSLAAYVAKFSRDGNLLWATKIDGISADPVTLAIGSGAIYVGVSVLAPQNASAYSYNVLASAATISSLIGMKTSAVVKITYAGVYSFTLKLQASTTSSTIAYLDGDSTGGVVVLLNLIGSLTAYTTTGVNLTTYPSSTGTDGHVLKYSSAGALSWRVPLISPNSEALKAVTVDASDNIYIATFHNDAGLPKAYHANGYA